MFLIIIYYTIATYIMQLIQCMFLRIMMHNTAYNFLICVRIEDVVINLSPLPNLKHDFIEWFKCFLLSDCHD